MLSLLHFTVKAKRATKINIRELEYLLDRGFHRVKFRSYETWRR